MRRTILLVVGLVLSATACGGGNGGGAGSTVSTEPGALPDFGGTTIDGQELVSADYAGQDVILWFWAPW